MTDPRSLTFQIPGRPYTKKTSQRIVKCGRFSKILPSEEYERYEAYCIPIINCVKGHLEFGGFMGKVNMKAVYTMADRRSWPDLTGLMQATADILQKAGMIFDDKNIVSWDGTRIEEQVDKEKVGVVITIEEVTPF